MSLSAGVLTYEICDGQSYTWGPFGQGEHLQVSITTAATSLDAYSTQATVDNSGAGWQSNRVEHLSLKAVRYYAGGNLVATDSTPRELVIHTAETE
jgi:hypothetical protein